MKLRSAARCAWPAPTRTMRFTRGAGCRASRRRLELRFFALAELLALHLAGGGHRQRVDELDLARILVGREAAADMALDLIDQFTAAGKSGLQHDEGFDDRAARRVGLADHRRVRHRGMLHQAALDLSRPDAVAGALDHVVGASLVPEVADLVHAALVAGQAPVADELLARRFRGLPVFE